MTTIAPILQQLHQSPIAYYPCYARLMGSVAGGVILSQLLFHFGKYGRRFYKNDKELLTETCCSVRELREAKKRLKELPFLRVTVEGMPATTWYEVLPDALCEALAVQTSSHDAVQTSSHDGVPTGSHDGVPTITEISTESTTTKIPCAMDAATVQSGKPAVTPEMLQGWYNAETPPTHPKVQKLSPARRQKAAKYLHLFPDPIFWHTVFHEIGKSAFLLGHKASNGHEGFRADFDWLLTKGKDGTENCVKVCEGRYRDPLPNVTATGKPRGAYLG